ncbi:MAG: 3-isopropylmalate dehydratase large subunit [Clostridiales bacterium]|nr:3-isopropylmalate dehydratase large subunit [Clostridiales bacterium]MCF8022446.1 3-isopropylmalate dehydratase large subunit [Clostridiales bacterium]
MAMTITEKIIAAHAGRDSVAPGELVNAKVDIALGNDITAPVAIREFEKLDVKTVWDKHRVVLVPDHFVPNKDIQSAEQAKMLREFSRRHELVNYFELGRMGIEHCLLPEQGLVLPGDLIIGADSHTCTYGALGAFSTGVGSTDLAAAMALGEIWLKVPAAIKFVYSGELSPWVGGKDLILYTIGKIGVDGARYRSMEFTGPVIEGLEIDGRMTMANMAVEAGAKNGIIIPDDITKNYVTGRARREYDFLDSDPDANYEQIYDFDVTNLSPQVALPHLPENVKPVEEAGDISIDQAVIGSCTNGRISDLRQAASVLKGKKIDPRVRAIIFPGTQEIYRQAVKEGLVEIFIDAGAAVSTPTCGPCLGGHAGILGAGERAISTTNRNFVGRMGHPESEVYLSNPAVAAASAVAGRIIHPGEVA